MAVIAISALIGVNNGFFQSLMGVRNTLTNTAPNQLGQTNAAVSSALSNAPVAADASSPSTATSSETTTTAPPSETPTTSTAPDNVASTIASAINAQGLLSQIDPANLPEVSGSSSDIATIANNAVMLLQAAAQLETLAQSNGGLDVSQLVYNARRLATAQYALAGEMMAGLEVNVYNQKAVDLGNSLLAQKLDDKAVSLLVNQSKDGFNSGDPSNFGGQSQILFNDYQMTFEPLRSFIQQQGLQTQQATTVLANGGNINNQNPVNTSGDTTIADANAINLCQDANCTVAGP